MLVNDTYNDAVMVKVTLHNVVSGNLWSMVGKWEWLETESLQGKHGIKLYNVKHVYPCIDL